jgi:hypothetical protein
MLLKAVHVRIVDFKINFVPYPENNFKNFNKIFKNNDDLSRNPSGMTYLLPNKAKLFRLASGEHSQTSLEWVKQCRWND